MISWLKALGILTLITVVFWGLRPYLPSSETNAPLADPAALRLLVEGRQPSPPPVEEVAQFHGRSLPVPALPELNKTFTILGASQPGSAKRIEIDLTQQKVYAVEGDRRVLEFTVSTGKWGLTPTGTFRIWTKVRSQKMSGGDMALGTYYYLPNVPWVMFFYNQEMGQMRGLSLHGTYWHNNFGHPMSHGCINMRTPDAALLYNWADPVVTDPKAWATFSTAENPGTTVVIYGETPQE